MLQISDRGSVRVVRMAHGKVNALDIELLAALRDALEAATRDTVTAIVLTGSGSSFSAGLDLFRVVSHRGKPEIWLMGRKIFDAKE